MLRSGNLDDAQRLLVDVIAAGANEIEGVEFDVAAKPVSWRCSLWWY